MKKLSLALATYNEELNIAECITSCKDLVDEVVVVDGCSTDKTGKIALEMGATVIRTQNVSMFHINKQKAIEACSSEWILQLDADERVTPELAAEIKKVIGMTNEEIIKYQESLEEKELFARHQKIVQGHRHPELDSGSIQFTPGSRVGARDDKQNQNTNDQRPTTHYNAFFIPRLNFFLGGYLKYGGVYPDGVIRLIKKSKAYLPCKDVHELMTVEGETGWLANPLIHKDSPTFQRYLERNSRYIDRLVEELKVESRKSKVESSDQKNTNDQRPTTLQKLICFQLIDWVIIKPIFTFFSLLIRHKGILDGWRGVVWAFFSAIRFARAYGRYLKS